MVLRFLGLKAPYYFFIWVEFHFRMEEYFQEKELLWQKRDRLEQLEASMILRKKRRQGKRNGT